MICSRIIFYFVFFLFAFTCAYAQAPKPLNGHDITIFQTWDSIYNEKNSYKSRLISNGVNADYQVTGNPEECNTSTFYMRIPAAAGEKIDLQELQTLPDENFVVVGNTTTNEKRCGFVLKMSNSGVVIKQQQLTINNKSCTISAMKVTLEGLIIVTGTVNDGSNTVFVTELDSNLKNVWANQLQMPSSIRSGCFDRSSSCKVLNSPLVRNCRREGSDLHL